MSDAVTMPNPHQDFYATPVGRLLLIYQNTAAHANYLDTKADGAMTPEVTDAWCVAGKALNDLIAALSAPPAPVGEVGELLAGIDELAGKATARPWEADARDHSVAVRVGASHTSTLLRPHNGNNEDAAFIVALVNAWPHLRRLASEGETLRENLRGLDHDYGVLLTESNAYELRAKAAESDNSRLRGKVEEAVKVHKRLSSAIARLGTVKDGKPLFESSPSKDPDCYDAWVELNEAQRDARGEKVKRFSEAWLRDKILDDQDDPQAGPEITP